MTTAALTPQERQALNAWIAEHVYSVTSAYPNGAEFKNYTWYAKGTDLRIVHPNDIPNYAGDWTYAGPLFDRYPLVLHNHPHLGYADVGYYDDREDWLSLAEGTTGPEAIAKACKAWEETKR